jgi:glycosyltransferase involved in cell wall biosynthesis
MMAASERLRVLVIAPTPFFGDRGCHVRIYEEVRAVKPLGIETLVVTFPTGRDLPDVTTIRAAAIPGFRARELGPSYGRVVIDASLAATAMRAARRFKPHVLHAHLHEGIFIGEIVRRLAWRVPLVADLQGGFRAELTDHGFVSERSTMASLLERFERWLVGRPDLLLVSSPAVDDWLQTLGVSPERVERLPDGVDLNAFTPRPPDPGLVARLGLAGKKVVVFLGVLTPYQGVDLLLEAVPAVAAAVPDVHFLVMGYPNVEHYQGLVRARGLEPWVTLPGRIPYAEASSWLNLGTLAVSAKQSLTEANGKLPNYMACGLPVVATDTIVNRELLGESGVFVPIGRGDALARELVALLGDDERRARLGAALHARAVNEYAWPALGERLASVYERLAHVAPARALSVRAAE